MDSIPSAESRQNILERIAAKRCDPETFEGFLIWTQIPNIPEIVRSGFQQIELRRRPHWKYGGQYTQSRWQHQKSVSMTTYSPRVLSFNKNILPWPHAGQVAVLLDKSIDKDAFDRLDEWHDTGDMVVEHRVASVSPDLIRGFVLNPNSVRLSNPRNTRTQTLPFPDGGIDTFEQPQEFPFSQVEYEQMLIKRLDRLVGTPYAKYLAPLYRHTGEMIWPRERSENGSKAE